MASMLNIPYLIEQKRFYLDLRMAEIFRAWSLEPHRTCEERDMFNQFVMEISVKRGFFITNNRIVVVPGMPYNVVYNDLLGHHVLVDLREEFL